MSDEGRTIWVYRDGVLVDRRYAPPLHPQFGTAPGVIRDGMEPTMNPANGKRYDSKRAYEKAVRAAGCEIIGNEKPQAYVGKRKAMSDPGETIKRSLEIIESRTPTPRRKTRKSKA